MNKLQIIDTIRSEKPFLKDEFGVEEIAIFGSYARGEELPESDLDILVKMKDKSLTSYFGLLDFLEAKLNKKIDLVTNHKNLSERFLHFVHKDIVYV